MRSCNEIIPPTGSLMLRTIANLLPTRVVTWLNQLRFRFPMLRGLIEGLAQIATGSGIGTISRGEGRGLRINVKGCNPGFLFGTSEPLEQRTLARHLKTNGVFFDVGANAGFYCLIAARLVGTRGKVIAFEPTPALCERITENAQLNEFANIEVVPKAVGANVGEIEFGVFSGLSVQNSINSAGSADRTVIVPCTTLDSLVTSNNAPTLIMIDVEGAELDVLVGARVTISRFLPTIMVEVHWLGEQFTRFVRENLEPLGYKATTYDGLPLPEGITRYHCLLTVSER